MRFLVRAAENKKGVEKKKTRLNESFSDQKKNENEEKQLKKKRQKAMSLNSPLSLMTIPL